MKIKIIYTENKMQTSVVSVITPSLKEIGPQMSEYKPTLELFCLLLLLFLTKSHK